MPTRAEQSALLTLSDGGWHATTLTVAPGPPNVNVDVASRLFAQGLVIRKRTGNQWLYQVNGLGQAVIAPMTHAMVGAGPIGGIDGDRVGAPQLNILV